MAKGASMDVKTGEVVYFDVPDEKPTPPEASRSIEEIAADLDALKAEVQALQ